jgi:cytoskeletal protein CcmA (bactofilin family)
MFGKNHPKLDVVIGSESVFKGELSSKGTVRIDGRFEGNINADYLIIGETGIILGDISSKTLIAGGKITGNVRATDSVEIQPKGEIYGDISTTKLSVAEGAVFEGRSSMQKNREIEYKPASATS